MPSPTRPHALRHPRLAIVLAGALLAFSGAAAPPPLAALAPASTFLAVQVVPGGASYAGLASDLAALPVKAAAGTLETALRVVRGDVTSASSTGDAARLIDTVLALLQGRRPADALTRACPALASSPLPRPEGALLAVSATPYAPLPAALVVARTAPGDAAAAGAAVRALTGCFGAGAALQQSGVALQPMSVGGTTVFVAVDGDLVAVASNADLLRAALRLARGSGESSLAAQLPASVPALDGPGLGIVLRARALGNVVAVLPGLAADPTARAARGRLASALRTVPLAAAHLRAAPEGVLFRSWTRVATDGGDAVLAGLLRCQGCRARPSLLVPANAVSVAAEPLRLEAWTDYLSGLVRDVAAAGGSDIDPLALLKQRTGLDLAADLFPWLGRVATEVAVPAPAGTPQALVGAPARVTIVPVASADAARAGLARLGPSLRALVARLPNAGAGGAAVAPAALIATRTERYRDVSITRIQIGPSADLGVALVGSRLVLASPSAALHAIIDTYRGAPTLHGGPLASALAAAPAGASAVWASDDAAMLHGSAALLRTLSQPLAFAAQAGLAAAQRHAGTPGAGPAPGLADLLAVAELPSDALDTLASHLGVARGYSLWQDGTLTRQWLLPVK